MKDSGTKEVDRWSVFDQCDQSPAPGMLSLQCNWASMLKNAIYLATYLMVLKETNYIWIVIGKFCLFDMFFV